MRRIVIATVVGLAVAVLALGGACSSDDDESPSETTPTPSETTPTTAGTSTDSSSTTGSDTAAELPAWATVRDVSTNLEEEPTFELTPSDDVADTVYTEDVVVGEGAEATGDSSVTVHYLGVLTDGTSFDSSWERGEPITFALDSVIEGWAEGIPGMKVGGRRVLVIPPDQAYGSSPLPGIPPDATLVFVVDLIDVQGTGGG